MCTHAEKEGITKCVRCEEEEAVQTTADLGERLDRHNKDFFLGTLKNGVPASRRWRKVYDQSVCRVVTARVAKAEIPAMLESLLPPQTRLANGQAKLPNKGQPLAHYVALAQAEKHSAKEWVPDHVDEWWDSVQGV